MTSDKKNISLLRALFVKKGLTDIVLSPGSRNAPIIIAFAGAYGVRAYSVVDERSAAFFALGMAKQTGRAVAIASTSGSAPLNYAPAIAEAYYQKIPLLILTADRPSYLVDIGDGQTIRQNNMYANYVKKSYELPLEIETKQQFEESEKIINEAIDLSHFPEPGPVHINIPFDEPLYGKTENELKSKVINYKPVVNNLGNKFFDDFAGLWNSSKKIIILAGQQFPSVKLKNLLERLATMPQTVVLTETTSNFYNDRFIDCIDNVLTTIKGKEKEYAPDFLITFGGAVVSKMVKKFLRKYKPKEHWHISPSGEKLDTYFSLKRIVTYNYESFFEKIISQLQPVESNYGTLWMQQKLKAIAFRKNFIKEIVFSDLKVFDYLMNNIPEDSNLHLGNSTPVRYSQLFGSLKKFTYFSNRGVSGIDGQISTAAGIAFFSEKINTVITGDLGFFYDSNALMNKYLRANFKIIIINNEGGGIFRFIQGPDTTPFLEDFFEAKHSWHAEGIARAFNIHYYRATNEWELKAQLPILYKLNKRPGILEIVTPEKKSAEILRSYFEKLATDAIS